MKTGRSGPSKMGRIVILVVCCATLIGIGVLGMDTLAGLKTTPAKISIKETPLQVQTVDVRFEDIPTAITGYGKVKSVKTTEISSEIPGKVIRIHDRLDVGESISKNELLVKIDTCEQELLLKANQTRLNILKRNMEISRKEYLRRATLFNRNKIGTLYDVEQSELNYNTISEQVNQLEYSIKTTNLTIKRASIYAPFNGRIKTVFVETGQYLSPGIPIVTLVDDSLLEIHVPIDSEKAKQYLRFLSSGEIKTAHWFNRLEQVPCKITWSKEKNEIKAIGFLHRIVSFNPKTRTITLAVRLNAMNETEKEPQLFPIVEGMFCKVTIPGKIVEQAIKLPSQAVSFKNTVHIVRDSRLKTIPIKSELLDDEFTMITAGLNENDRVIINRLSDPLENSLVQSETITLGIVKK